MAYTFMKAEGGNIGNSLCEEDRVQTAIDLLSKATAKGVCIHLPSDSIIADKFDVEAQTSTSPSNNIPDGWMGLDIGPNACEQFANVISRSKTILWNGPMVSSKWINSVMEQNLSHWRQWKQQNMVLFHW